MHYFRIKLKKKFRGEGTAPLQTPLQTSPPLGSGTSLDPAPIGAYIRRLDPMSRRLLRLPPLLFQNSGFATASLRRL